MKILVDENIPSITVQELKRLGHETLDIRGTPLQGIPDAQLWSLAQAEQRMVITTDKGFSGHRDENHHGILIIRLRQPNEHRIHARILAALRQFPEPSWPGLLVVMRDNVQSIKKQ
jgi:predicted nuclease of predicted toxin-antitoxin system